MPMRAVVVWIKGDWSEFNSTLGLPAWNDGLRPCFECAAYGGDMFNALGNSPLGLRGRASNDMDYENACRRCERQVGLDERTKQLVLDVLKYDKRGSGAHGRALTQAIPELNLMSGDRLEPCEALRDIGKFESLVVPVTVTFWRTADESLARHRNPLFSAELGTSPSRTLTIDVLHALYPGS